MGNELSRTGDIITNFFIDDNYKINNELEWTDVIQDYIMRYRRIIGIIILVILLVIMRNCNWNKSNLKIKTTNNEEILVAKGGALPLLAAAPIASALTSGAGASGAAALASGAAGSGGAAALASGAAGSGGAAALASTVGQSVGANVAQNLAKDAMPSVENGRSKSRKVMDFASGGKYSAMREAGFSKFRSGLELTRQGGQYVADKFKEFASWLYEILFAIAISIAICMIVVPSIAFFALGLICYFLLRKKLITMKAF